MRFSLRAEEENDHVRDETVLYRYRHVEKIGLSVQSTMQSDFEILTCLRGVPLLLTAIATVVSCANGQVRFEQFGDIIDRLSTDYDYRGRIYSVSTSAPIRSILDHDEKFKQSTHTIQTYLHSIEGHIISKLQSSTRQSLITNDTGFTPCNTDADAFKDAYRAHVRARYMPDPDNTCYSEYVFEPRDNVAISGTSIATLSRALVDRAKAVYGLRRQIVHETVANWTEPDTAWDYQVHEDSLYCPVNNIGAVRYGQGQQWFLRTYLTNRPVNEHAEDFQRFYLYEYLRTIEKNITGNGGKPELQLELDTALTMRTAIRPVTGIKPTFENNATTLLDAGIGSVPPTAFERTFDMLIPAIPAAIEMASHARQQQWTTHWQHPL